VGLFAEHIDTVSVIAAIRRAGAPGTVLAVAVYVLVLNAL
jgi:hypothetical protein